MKNFTVFLVVPLFFLIFTAAREPAPLPVAIADPNLAAAISAAVNLPADQLAPAALRRLRRLNATGRDIRSLEGIQHCTGLIELNLSRNSISDLGPLAGLRELTILDLSHNQVSDLSPLARLLCLTDIRLQFNQISDITALSRNNDDGGLPYWTWVYLDDNPLSARALEIDVPYLVAEGVTVSITEEESQATLRQTLPSSATGNRRRRWRP